MMIAQPRAYAWRSQLWQENALGCGLRPFAGPRRLLNVRNAAKYFLRVVGNLPGFGFSIMGNGSQDFSLAISARPPLFLRNFSAA